MNWQLLILTVFIVAITSAFCIYIKTKIHSRNANSKVYKDLEKFKLAVDNTNEHVIISDNKGSIIYANKSAERITGYSINEMMGTKAGKLWGGLMEKSYYEKLWKTLTVDKKPFTGQIKNRRKNGDIYHALINLSPVFNKKGEVEFFVGIERDITKEIELNEAKDEFLSMASHELRTPLAAIDGIISMIRGNEYGDISDEVRKALDDVNGASERLIKLVNDLLSLSRIHAGRLKYDINKFNISESVSEVCDLFKAVLEKKNIQMKANSESVMVRADKDKVEQVLNNLLSNANKFTDQGYVEVSAKKDNDMVKISVRDTGIGMPDEGKNKLFGKFEQIANNNNRPQGTGLGLHISREMIRKMGGDLWLQESELGKGSVFVFTVPIEGTDIAKKVLVEINKEALSHPDQKSDKIVKS